MKRSRRSRRKRLWLGLSLALLVVVTLGAALAWRLWLLLRPRPLEANWSAAVVVLAGDGVAGVNDADATNARFSDPFGVAVAANGIVYVADGGNAHRIRSIATDGRVTTIAGGAEGFADGLGSDARFSSPSGLAIDAGGTLYVADTGNNAIRRITPDGYVSTLAGTRIAGYRDGPAPQAQFNGPVGVAVDSAGRVIVADTYNDRIRAIEPDGTVRTLAGSTVGTEDGPGAEARFNTPCGVAVDASGNIHVADTGNGVVRVIDRGGRVSTVALPETLGHPIGIAVSPTGDRYVADEHGRVVAITGAGQTRTLAGTVVGFRDGAGNDALFRRPAGLALAGPARLIVADAGNALIRLVAASSQLEVRPPASPRIAPRFDADAFGLEPLLWPVSPLEGPHEIAGTIGEARGSEGSERFHAGVDVRADEGTTVYAVRDGFVSSPIAANDFGSINEWVRIGALAYVHIRAGRERDGTAFDDPRFVPLHDESGKVTGMRVKRGARFETGEAIGTVNGFNHVHMNVGWPGEEYNPLAFRLMQFEDTKPPTIARGGVRICDEHGQPFAERARGRLLISGRVEVVVDAWDEANDNRPGRRLGLYDLGYQVLNRDGSPAPGFENVRHTMRFDRLAVDPNAARLVYAPGSGIPFYGRRRTRFLYIVTDSFHDGIASEGFWDTTLLAPGDYIVRAWAADINGNVAVANRDLAVTVLPAVK